MLTKSELQNLWRNYNFRPKKNLGQNFLIDKNIKNKILRSLDLLASDTVVEIGSGFGEITFDLTYIAKEVFAIEKDGDIVQIFKERFSLPPNLTVIQKDFLDTNLKKIASGKKVVVYGNLPYYVTSPIIEMLITNLLHIRTIYLVVQKEVGERIVALPNSKNIGRLSLYVQYYTTPVLLFKIKKSSFHPTPKVDSVFLRLEPQEKKKVFVKDETLFFAIIKKAYSQRRKTILNCLAEARYSKDRLLPLLLEAAIDPSARAENLALEDFARLANAVCRLRF